MLQMYTDFNKLYKDIDKISIMMTINAGDFNAKIEKRNGSERCMGIWSRSKRNEIGSKLLKFCKINNKIMES